eukprot:FR742078.1.p1 GENE.FR742078.1~~FR742078.1.p1  ORF type:complete len:373 (+),score=29.71 FR742078.1:39-1121(+)
MENGNKVIKGYVDDCIMTLIQKLKFRSEVSMICNVALSHKNKEGRDACSRYVLEMTKCWGTPYLDPESDTIHKMISKCLEDSSPATRETTRTIFFAFVELYPSQRNTILEGVGHRTRKLLGGLSADSKKSKDAKAGPALASTSSVYRGFSDRKPSRKRSTSAKPASRRHLIDRVESMDDSSLSRPQDSESGQRESTGSLAESRRTLRYMAATTSERSRRTSNSEEPVTFKSLVARPLRESTPRRSSPRKSFPLSSGSTRSNGGISNHDSLVPSPTSSTKSRARTRADSIESFDLEASDEAAAKFPGRGNRFRGPCQPRMGAPHFPFPQTFSKGQRGGLSKFIRKPTFNFRNLGFLGGRGF